MNDLPDDVICNISIYADDTTLYSKCDPVSDLWQQLELASKLFFFLIGIHPMQGWTATTRHGVTRKEAQKRLQGTENLFKKNLRLKDVC